ncbi:RNA polymerase sigma-70 factor [Rhodohalobacter sp. SW132]|uniref:RNA polymerase sigma factor n=1 Tax=Rhodohalobacter sp. SW132 TaxID=2293433 RepID=UPI000E27A8E7|nr:RNA polymerase sigma-70 factor [Rhodohalobacter sp. SW132]REL38069.1 RNA polymerase sigma-70 factor [Rhodohalobacter sp. SW132]
MHDLNDTKLVQKIIEGSEEAFREIYWLYCDQLHRLAFQFLRDQQLAEDAVQDIFLKLWNQRHQLDENRSIKGFLLISLKNHVLNLLKINKRRILRQFEYSRINTNKVNETDGAVICSELHSLIEHCLENLPVAKRRVYELKRVGDFSNKEIASELGLSENTVKSHYYLAKKKMQELIFTYQNSSKKTSP